MRSLILLIILVLTATVLPAQSDFTLLMPGYRVSIGGPIVSTGNGIVVAQLDSLPRDRRSARFGMLFPTADQGSVLELHDGVSGAVLAKMSSAQWQGRAPASWVPNPLETSNDRIVESFRLQQGKLTATIIRTIERVTAPHLPMGVGLRYTIGLANVSVPSVRVVLRGTLEGSSVLNGQLVTITSMEQHVPLNATVVLLWTEGTSVRLDGAAKARALVARGSSITANGDVAVTAISLTVAGTTSPVAEHQSAQATALLDHFKGRPARPILVARTLVDRPKATPGDTVHYRLTYYNVGTAQAAEVELSNPVPQGSRYLDGSSKGADSEIAETREAADPPVVGRVTDLTWRFRGTIAPGASRWASFMVIVQ